MNTPYRFITILIIVVLFTPVVLFGAETDGFSSRYSDISDAVPSLNLEINKRIQKAVVMLNKKSKVCDYSDLDSHLGDQLRMPIKGQIESYILASPHIPKSKISLKSSILKDLTTYHYTILKIGEMIGINYSPAIKHKNFLIGIDKFGHFFNEGYYYYKLVNHWGYTIDEAIKFGNFLESYLEGNYASGIYSYADLSANYEGYLFWEKLLGSTKRKIKSNIFECNAGIWTIKHEVDLAQYIGASWDEGMNCNSYQSRTMELEIQKAITALENKQGKRYACPVFPNLVKKMKDKYGTIAKDIINPKL